MKISKKFFCLKTRLCINQLTLWYDLIFLNVPFLRTFALIASCAQKIPHMKTSKKQKQLFKFSKMSTDSAWDQNHLFFLKITNFNISFLRSGKKVTSNKRGSLKSEIKL